MTDERPNQGTPNGRRPFDQYGQTTVLMMPMHSKPAQQMQKKTTRPKNPFGPENIFGRPIQHDLTISTDS